MPDFKMVKAITKEYGIPWALNRSLYSAKLKMLVALPSTASFFEKKTKYPSRLDLFDIDIVALKSMLEGLSKEDKEYIIHTADNACQGIVRGFSSVDLNYGIPIDWQLSPLTGKRCDERLPWYKIPDFDENRGDIKVIWEASRFSHFIAFSRAYLLTRNIAYYHAFSSQLDNWLKANPYSHGANFKCGQECSFRIVNVLLAYSVFREEGVATDADRSNVRDLVDRCYRKVLSNFFYARKCIKNNHTISELMGMIIGAWCCEDEKQLQKAISTLDDVIGEQFNNDGGYCQLSFNYQRLALQDLECVLSIEKKIGKQLSQQSKEKIKKSALLMYQCQDECGDVPNYGYNDGALVFPLTSCNYRDFRPVINTAYFLITGKELYDYGKHQEELIWFSGRKKTFEEPFETVEKISSHFPEAGLFTIRGKQSWAMIVSNEYRSRPSHMDQNHLDLWVEGINVLCDAGTYSYTGDIGKIMVRNESHNTVTVNGRSQMNTHGPFMIYDWTKRELIHLDNTSFEGKTISQNGYAHVRQIKQVGTSYEITDNVDQEFILKFHTPCDVRLENGKALLSYKGNLLCMIQSEGSIKLEESSRSLFYLRQDSTTCLSIRGHANTNTKTVILINL